MYKNDELKDQMLAVHGHQCVISEVNEATKEALKQHTNDHHSFACTHCDNKSITEEDAQKHKELNQI